MINTYMYVWCICMYSMYIFYIFATYNSIYTRHIHYLYTAYILYTTYTTRLQIDRHYLCTTTYCTYYHIEPMYRLFGCTSYYNFPIQHMQPPSHPNPHHRDGIPWTHCTHNHLPPRGDQKPGTYMFGYVWIIYEIYIELYWIEYVFSFFDLVIS